MVTGHKAFFWPGYSFTPHSCNTRSQQQSAQMPQEFNMPVLRALRTQVSRGKERYLHRRAAACPRPQKTHTAVWLVLSG